MWSPLDPQCHEFRLLHLQPGPPSSPLRGHLTTHALSSPNCAEYNALSYACGDPITATDPQNTILVSGSPLGIPANLKSALLHFRDAHASNDPQTICLWADAICIDQTNLAERSQQVAMMRQIYASAKRVLIWLGEETKESEGVFEALPLIAGTENPKDVCRSEVGRRCAQFFPELRDTRPWFTRVWIAQEVAVARDDPLVFCGRRSVYWSVFVKAWQVIAREVFTEIGMVRMRAPSQSLGDNSGSGSSSENNDDNVEVLALIKPDILNDLRESQQRNGGETLPKLLYTQRTAQCTDPRDRVYGLLGLLRPQDDDDTTVIKIRPDYTKPTWEVYADAMSHIFSTGQGPYFLSGVFLPGLDTPSPPIPAIPITGGPKDRKQYRNQQKAEGHLLPSWVPDLSRQVGGQATQPSGLFFHPPAGRSASGAGAICKNGWRVSERVLKVEGLSVDTIHEVLSFGASTEEVVGNLPRFENATKQAIERSRAHPEHEPDSIKAMIQSFGVKEPLWRTLISNRRYISGYDDAPSVYEDMYLQLRLHPDISASALQDDDNEYRKCLAEGKANKSFFTTTSSGLVGTCVPDSRAGDTVAILFGSPTPFVLRPLRVEGDYGKVYALIGGCYTGGIMDGEMVDELYCEDLVDSVPFYIT